MKKRLICCLLMMSIIMCTVGCSSAEGANVETPEVAIETTEVSEQTANEEEAVEETVIEETTAQETENTETESTEQSAETFEVPKGYDSVRGGVVYGEIVEITYDSTTTGTTRKANVMLPPNYDEQKQYPVLYLLHGSEGTHNEWKQGAPVNIISNLIADGEATEMIVVMPNVRARAEDDGNPPDSTTLEHWHSFDNFINDLRDNLMPYMEANYPILTGKENTAIAGLSLGGRASLYIGFSMPETFGYIGSFSPAPGILAHKTYDLVEEGLFTEESFTLPEGSDNLVMIITGASDTIVGKWPETYHNTLEKNGVEHKFYVIEGKHEFKVWKQSLYMFGKEIFK